MREGGRPLEPHADGRQRSAWLEEQAEVRAHERRGLDWFDLRLHAPQIAARALPGQFAQLQVRPVGPAGAGLDPLLRRPLSFCTLDPGRGEISVIYRVVGRGTALLAEAAPGQRLSLLGPLGSSFPDPRRAPARPLLLVGGGLGIPPLACAAAWALAAGRPTRALLGARTAGYLAGAAEVAAAGAAVTAVTEDGSAGRRGLVTAELAEVLTAEADVWACGPAPMLSAVQALCRQHGAGCWLCVERPMACGFGVCIGCAVARADGTGYLKACTDGPVLRGDEADLAG